MDGLDFRLQKRMHISLYALLFLTVLLGISVLLEGCTDSCETKIQYTYFEPVYVATDVLRISATIEDPRPMGGIGKIYRKDQLLFINDPGLGIHIINNSDPSNPIIEKFLNIPGNYDMAVTGNTLYADSYIDLVAFDISDVQQIHEVSRVENVFTNFNNINGFAVEENQWVITEWVEKEAIEVSQSDCSNNVQSMVFMSEGVATMDRAAFYSAINRSSATAPGNGSGPGAGGSMARFTIAGNFLYTLDQGAVQPFDITNNTAPIAKNKNYIAWDIETIFPYNSNLFIGSSSGMYILDLSNPESPQQVATYQHMSSCDPVVVQDNYAYVTLRSGTECQGFSNQLEVINIEDLQNPQLVQVYEMTNPHGLGIDQNTLFICDGAAGLKIFDASDVNAITSNLLAHYDQMFAYDVIPMGDLLVMISAAGLYQYDYSNPQDIKLLSHLPVHAN